MTLPQIAEQFAASRLQSGLTAHYASHCRKTLLELAKAFPDQALPDLTTTKLVAWMGSLVLGPKTKNGMRTMLIACGTWAEGRGFKSERSSLALIQDYFELEAGRGS